MKKIISLFLCFTFSLFLVACGGGNNNYGGMRRSPAAKNQIREPLNASMDEPDPTPLNEQVEALLDSYIVDGKYTKLTTLTYDDDAANYHAGANTRQRRTYYDETANALLMGNYDGTFGPINSGYALVGSDMWHYSNKAETKTTSNLFSQSEMSHDYTVYATGPNKFFDVLSKLADSAHDETNLSRWNLTSGVYTYTADEPATVYDSGSYTNGLLKVFQYFAAPMLLLNNNVKLQKFTVQEKDAYVGDDLTKVLFIELFDSTNAKLSEAIVAKGLTMDDVFITEENKVYLETGVWGEYNPWFAAYFFGKDPATWDTLAKVDGTKNIYSVSIPSGYSKLIFTRMDPSKNELDWSSKWGEKAQTQDLDVHAGKMFKINGWGNGVNPICDWLD